MMGEISCPFCKSKYCNILKNEKSISISCEVCRVNVDIGYGFDLLSKDLDLYQKALNAISEKIVKLSSTNHGKLLFYYDEKEPNLCDRTKINVFTLLKEYPHTFIEIINKTLLNIAHKYPTWGKEFYVDNNNFRLFYPAHGTFEEADGSLRMLAQMGYVMVDGVHSLASISAEGWKKIESLQKQQVEIKQGFVAMSFNPTTAEIREGFRQAISNAGYSMRAIDEKEHNNQIVPEIFYEIERSKFVVVDVTYPNYGAYYEAGYAYGLGKEVIVCCSKEAFENKDGSFERPHFDISQKSMVIWADIEDLKVRLTRRIQATVK